ncbi:MAG: tetratricopeptide repeat protein [Treponema sp.]|jgi:tetratricopeptide (TPR) repeat protein|nr:tetratricopeptide repeat protein [Treponema sp.]
MKKLTSVVLLLAGLTFAHATDKYAPAGNTLADALQWLAVQTASLGEYGMAFTGDFTEPDPRDNYRPSDIREYLAGQSGNRTRVQTIYGICFDYAQYAYNVISASQSYYEGRGMKSGQWYIAATWKNNPGVIRLFDPVARGGPDTISPNGVHIKEQSRRSVQNHGNRPMNHAWLWVIGNDGTTYWIDPTWTDGTGYVWWGVVRNGREEQVAPRARFCATRPPNSSGFASFTSGDANRNMGNYDQAIDDYNQTIRVEPNYAAAYNNRGRSYYAKGDYDKAIADFNQAITLDPNYADAYNNRGRAYYAKGDLDRALADYNQAITLDPESPLAFNGRAYVYLAQKDHERAYTDARQAIKLWPREPTWYITTAEIFLSMGNNTRAITDLENALKMFPNFTRAQEMLRRIRGR